jgi:hypothetical protein
MISHRMHAAALTAAFAIVCFAASAIAERFDGDWSMVAETTRGHYGTIELGLAIRGSRVYSTSGWFAFYPVRLTGRRLGVRLARNIAMFSLGARLVPAMLSH